MSLCSRCSTNGLTSRAGPSGLCDPCLSRAASGERPLGQPARTPLDRYLAVRARGGSRTLAAAMSGVSPMTAREKFEPVFLARSGLLPDLQQVAGTGSKDAARGEAAPCP
jgi:hypothetical protein